VRSAGREKFCGTLDLDKAEATGADFGQSRYVAERGNVDAVFACDFKNRLVAARAEVLAFNFERLDLYLRLVRL